MLAAKTGKRLRRIRESRGSFAARPPGFGAPVLNSAREPGTFKETQRLGFWIGYKFHALIFVTYAERVARNYEDWIAIARLPIKYRSDYSIRLSNLCFVNVNSGEKIYD